MLTIGVGHTGPDVAEMMITQSEADQLLAQDVERFEKAVTELIDVPLKQQEFDALVSFAFNCGAGAWAKALETPAKRRRGPGSAEELPLEQRGIGRACPSPRGRGKAG